MTAAKTPRRYRLLADEIAAAIAAGRYAEGARLPPERELATVFSVSRPTLREALIALELMGLVEVRGGSGVYVIRREPEIDAPLSAGPGVFEILEVRSILEPGVAALAATVIEDEEVERLRGCIAEMMAAFEAETLPDRADRRFHLSIAEATGNSAVAATIRRLWDMRAKAGTLRRLEVAAGASRLRYRAIEDHLEILSALRRRDAEGARAAMARHMENNVELLLATASEDERAQTRRP